ncbi:hypothetical protein PtA15_18A42 [Puccinia triticina]|uniref:Uncharacterized protein n=1 Tax=Puccinia triticina TaxID=208348 RepID=A0ABY7D6J3_9BASI|nr:uncharacterized protein PtA15_18A42 [Puccinia triticina]WAQ92986.1 hypothetical protein PtA15_18A42 [Puccinia triticina]
MPHQLASTVARTFLKRSARSTLSSVVEMIKWLSWKSLDNIGVTLKSSLNPRERGSRVCRIREIVVPLA